MSTPLAISPAAGAPVVAAPALVRASNAAGILAMLVGVVSFSIMDAALKVLAPHYPPLQVAALRGLASLPVVLAWVAWRGAWGELARVRVGLHVLRGLLSIGMLFGFVFAVRRMSLADAYALFFVAPLLIAALAGPVLGERVDRHRWAALGVGLVGVLVLLRPSGSGLLASGGLAMLLAALGYAFSALTVRVLSRTDSTVSMVFWMVLIVSVGATALAWPAWQPLHREHWPVLAAIAVAGTLGQRAVTVAFSQAEASVVAPFEYTALLWAAGIDWLIWRSRPGPWMLVGAAIVIGSGLYLLHRERSSAPR